MFYLATCGIISFITGILCAAFVFFHKPRNSLKVMWSLYSLGISLWGLGIFQFLMMMDPKPLLILSRAINLSSLFIPIFFFHFVVLLTGRFEAIKREVFLYYGLFASYWLTAFFLPQYFVKSISPKGGFLFYPDAGKLYYVFPVIFIYLIARGAVLLYQSYVTVSSARRNQYKYFAILSVLGLGGGATTFFLAFDIPIYPYGAILVPFYNLMVAYIIVKHQLMDIRVVIRKSLIYTILIASLTVIYMVGIYLLERVFSHALGYQSAMGSTAVFVTMAAVLVPLKNFIQSFVDRIFFKASYLQVVEQNELLRQQVMRAERYKTLAELSQGIIMEVRSPITTLIGYKYQLDKGLHDPQFLSKFTQVFDKELGRIQLLVNRLAEFSESKPLNIKPTDIVALVNEFLTLQQNQLKTKKIVLYRFYVQEKEVMLNIDSQQIKQALYHVFLASLRSMIDEGQVWFGMEAVDNYWEIRIKDTGQGLSEDALIRVFDPLINLQEEGGNALFKAQNIINNHGGKIIVQSEVGQGTEWIIQLPGIPT